MKHLAILFVLSAVQFGCSRSPDRPISSDGKTLPTKETAIASDSSFTSDTSMSQPVPPPDTGPSATRIVYPEMNEVLAILYRARELRQKSQFQSALELVSQALAVDPDSPAAQTMERELAEILMRLRERDDQHRTGSASRAA
jgi:hypothetical protein